MAIKSLPEQTFILSSEVLSSISHEVVESTYSDMAELGLVYPPYPKFQIVRTDDRLNGQLVHCYDGDTCEMFVILRGIKVPASDLGDEKLQIASCYGHYKALIVLLATDNHKQTTKSNSLGMKGIGKTKYYGRKITTISIGTITSTTDNYNGGSGTKCPHLRRGHKRVLANGKVTFVRPCFIHASEAVKDNLRTQYEIKV